MTHFKIFINSRKNLERDESATKSKKTGQISQMHTETEKRIFKEIFQKWDYTKGQNTFLTLEFCFVNHLQYLKSFVGQ